MRSASRSASSRYWVVSRIVVPPSARSAMNSHMPSRLRGIEPGGRLVQEQHPRTGDQRRGDVEPAAHAAGVRLRRPVGRVGEVEAGQQLVGPRPGLRLGQVVEPPDHLEVLEPGQVLVDGGVLAGQPDRARAPRRPRRTTSRPRTCAPAGVGPQQRGQDPHHRGLPGAVRAEQAQHRALGDGQVHPVERGGVAEALHQSFDRDGVCHDAAR